MSAITNTPWGPAQTEHNYADGITFVTTASHGGFVLSDERAAQLPTAYRTFAAKWSKGWQQSATFTNYYEEDCAALAVVATWPTLLGVDARDLPTIQAMLKDYVLSSERVVVTLT